MLQSHLCCFFCGFLPSGGNEVQKFEEHKGWHREHPSTMHHWCPFAVGDPGSNCTFKKMFAPVTSEKLSDHKTKEHSCAICHEKGFLDLEHIRTHIAEDCEF
ncbi:hypothetical protein T439DRAFT_144753 [Meredithblackwellia eburnea MCA 4105]